MATDSSNSAASHTTAAHTHVDVYNLTWQRVQCIMEVLKSMIWRLFKIYLDTQSGNCLSIIYEFHLATKKLKIVEWKPLISKIVAKISSWTAKKLSYAGRVQLIKSVIFGIQAYRAQMFILPAHCRRSYFWTGTNEVREGRPWFSGKLAYRSVPGLGFETSLQQSWGEDA